MTVGVRSLQVTGLGRIPVFLGKALSRNNKRKVCHQKPMSPAVYKG